MTDEIARRLHRQARALEQRRRLEAELAMGAERYRELDQAARDREDAEHEGEGEGKDQ